MNPSQLGLIENTENRLFKIDPDFVKGIVERRANPKITESIVRKELRNGFFTIKQFSDLSGLDTSTIHNLLKPTIINGEVGTKLDYCHPFPDSEGNGPKFIYRNDKSEKYLK
jgi:hypothetical protein